VSPATKPVEFSDDPRFKELQMALDFRLHKLDIGFFLFGLACFSAIALVAWLSPNIRRESAVYLVCFSGLMATACTAGIVRSISRRRKIRRILRKTLRNQGGKQASG